MPGSALRVAIISEDDSVWALPTWEHAIPALRRQGWDIAGLWCCRPRLGRLKPSEVKGWYLKTFGPVNFLKLGLFALLGHAARGAGALRGRRCWSFRALAAKHGIYHAECSTANDASFAAWLRDNRIDVLVIMVGDIVRPEVLSIPRVGVLNKHAALLPSNRGMFPYFWAHLKHEKQGISFHEVIQDVDGGRLLLQESVEPSCAATMIAFYRHVFDRYPEMLVRAVMNLATGAFVDNPAPVKASYHSLPTGDDYAAFERERGRVIDWGDLKLALR